MTDKPVWVKIRSPLADELWRRAGDLPAPAVLRRDLRRYYELIAAAEHGLSERELALVAEVVSDDIDGEAMVEAVVGAISVRRLDVRYDVDGAILTAKLTAMTPLQRLKVLDVIQRREMHEAPTSTSPPGIGMDSGSTGP